MAQLAYRPRSAEHLPTAQQQRCTVHKIRGLERQFCYRDLD